MDLSHIVDEVEDVSMITWVGGDYEKCKKSERIWIVSENSDINYDFLNINKLFYPGKKIHPQRIHDKTAFYNFFQFYFMSDEPEPRMRDYERGWKVFLNLLPYFNPAICLFMEDNPAKYLSRYIDHNVYSITEERKNVYRLEDRKGNQYKFIFLNDVSDIKETNEFLRKNMAKQLEELYKNIQ